VDRLFGIQPGGGHNKRPGLFSNRCIEYRGLRAFQKSEQERNFQTVSIKASRRAGIRGRWAPVGVWIGAFTIGGHQYPVIDVASPAGQGTKTLRFNPRKAAGYVGCSTEFSFAHPWCVAKLVRQGPRR